MPKVSVIMPVYNGEEYIREAVDSIIAQTFTDFELVVVDDGSTDKSTEIIKTYDDPRISLLHNEFDPGVIGARNTGIAHAIGDYIAMMDCDDISYPTRLEEQINFLDRNRDFGLVGTYMEMMDEEGRPMGKVEKYPEVPEAIPSLLLFNNYFTQSTVVMRKAALPEEHYRLYPGAEDYDLWVRIAQDTKVWNLQKVLVKYRIHTSSISFENAYNIKAYVREIISNQLALIHIKPTEKELDIHRKLGNMSFVPSDNFLTDADIWLTKLYKANEKVRYYDHFHFCKILAEQWIYVCAGSSELGPNAWKMYWASPLSRLNVLNNAGKLYLYISTSLKLKRKSRQILKRYGEKIFQWRNLLPLSRGKDNN